MKRDTTLRAATLAAVLAVSGGAWAQQGAAAGGGRADAGAAGAARGAAAAAPAAKVPAGKVEVTWWGHAAFVVRTPGGATIAIDPWLQNPKAPAGAQQPEQLDAILVTHGHFDHVGNTAELAKRTGAQVVGAFELTSLIGAQNSAGGNIGGSLKVKDVTIHMVEAVHSSGYSPDGKSAPQYGGSAMGYVLQVDGGPTLYHAGDTAVFSSMELIAQRFRPTHALLPIGGHFTMDPAGAALAAKLLKVRTVVPMHFGTFPVLVGTPAQLQAELKRAGAAGTRVQELQPGQAAAL